MRFKITHQTEYQYRQPASESFAELRVWPQDTSTQKVLKRRLEISPRVTVDTYKDYFGNNVEFFSIPYRHTHLRVSAHAEVETRPEPDLESRLQVTVAEWRQILNSQLPRYFDFMQSTSLAPLSPVSRQLRKKFLHPQAPLGEALLEINHWIHKNVRYEQGVTDITTPLETVLKQRSGVCQDFAHLMLAILRVYRLPARYVSGYVEPADPNQPGADMIGAAASHAWVEVFLPGNLVFGLDPTNDIPTGERHVKVAAGRDYHDVAPMRGTYKGAKDQKLNVIVSLQRREHEPEPATVKRTRVR